MALTDETLLFNIPNHTVYVDENIATAIVDTQIRDYIIAFVTTKILQSGNYQYNYTALYADDKLEITKTEPDNVVTVFGTPSIGTALYTTGSVTNTTLETLPTTSPLYKEDNVAENNTGGYAIMSVRNEASNANYLAGTVGDYQNLQSTEDGSLKVYMSGYVATPATPAQLTRTTTIINSAGTVATGAKSVSFFVLTGTIVFDGVTYSDGEGYNYSAGDNYVFDTFNYDATLGTARLIVTR